MGNYVESPAIQGETRRTTGNQPPACGSITIGLGNDPNKIHLPA